MNIEKIQLSGERLLGLPEVECTFFLALGHVTNEVNAITKLLYWTANVSTEDHNPQSHGSFSFNLLLIQLLAGKLFEAWEFFGRGFFRTGLSRDYEVLLDEKAAKDLGDLKKYFGRKNAANHIRNNFAFHYSSIDAVPLVRNNDSPLYVYLERHSAPNSLFYSSEVIYAQALFASLEKAGLAATSERLVDEFFTISAALASASDGLMDAIILKNATALHLAPWAEVHIAPLPDFRAVTVPWFTDTSGIIDSLHSG